MKYLFLLFAALFFVACSKDHMIGKKCVETAYYFKAGDTYLKADNQEFRIMFTGEVANAYFYKGTRKYSTMDYYKEDEYGIFKKQGSEVVCSPTTPLKDSYKWKQLN